ncbi:uncharacterized protein [Epargyreus clarus]|uniref:uncharacterized protein isoform X2 n=1 Tax=Epargyreus clarus TaxID=520877 RepID=UPI003C2F7D06
MDLKMEFQGWMLRLPWILLLFLVASGEESSNSTEVTPTVVCEREHAYDDLEIEEVAGKWDAVELYMHLRNEGVNTFESCPKLIITELNEAPTSTFGPSTEHQAYHVQHINAKLRQSYRYLRLLWDEAGETIEYSLYFSNASAGYWQTFETQTGSLTSRPSYQQFSGTVQVLKAVDDHLVLSFCQEASNSAPAQLYSILFSREPGVLVRWEIDAVHAMLQNKKLSIASRRMVCGNSADKPIYSIIFSIFTCALAYAISS